MPVGADYFRRNVLMENEWRESPTEWTFGIWNLSVPGVRSLGYVAIYLAIGRRVAATERGPPMFDQLTLSVSRRRITGCSEVPWRVRRSVPAKADASLQRAGMARGVSCLSQVVVRPVWRSVFAKPEATGPPRSEKIQELRCVGSTGSQRLVTFAARRARIVPTERESIPLPEEPGDSARDHRFLRTRSGFEEGWSRR